MVQKQGGRARVVRAAAVGVGLAAILTLGSGALPADARAVAPEAPPTRASQEGWRWPVLPSPIVAGYSAPATRYSAGHRGVDLATTIGAVVSAPADGVVVYAGMVADRPVLSIAHRSGLVSSFEPVIGVPAVGSAVRSGEPVGVVADAPMHCSSSCLHFGVRRNGQYVSPVSLIDGIDRAVLLPLGG